MNDKIEFVKRWFEKADHDLGTAQITFKYLPEYKDTIAFHCQQAVEKYLKGYLSFLEIEFRKIHSLNYLLSILSARVEISDELFEKATVIEDFSVEIRYPDTTISLSDDDIIQALSIAKFFRNYVIQNTEINISYLDDPNE